MRVVDLDDVEACGIRTLRRSDECIANLLQASGIEGLGHRSAGVGYIGWAGHQPTTLTVLHAYLPFPRHRDGTLPARVRKLHAEPGPADLTAEADDLSEPADVLIGPDAEALGTDAPTWLDGGRLGEDETSTRQREVPKMVSAEYCPIGDTTMRLSNVTERRRAGVNSLLLAISSSFQKASYRCSAALTDTAEAI